MREICNSGLEGGQNGVEIRPRRVFCGIRAKKGLECEQGSSLTGAIASFGKAHTIP
jgi:hypothetical protein